MIGSAVDRILGNGSMTHVAATFQRPEMQRVPDSDVVHVVCLKNIIKGKNMLSFLPVILGKEDLLQTKRTLPSIENFMATLEMNAISRSNRDCSIPHGKSKRKLICTSSSMP
jgi:hypothetical protein